jgi:exodeoxyribonuclease VII large subunit
MGRLPFDPKKMRGSTDATPPEPRPGVGDGVLTVSRLASLIRGVVDDHLPSKVRVVGEISGARRSTHLYFSLKDSGAVISATVFASTLRKVGFEPRDGQEIIATGRIEFYEPQGRVTLIVEKLEPIGQGAHELRFRQLCDELRELGWFEVGRKRPLPTFPRRVAVITSRTGAALQDVLSTMAKRCPSVAVSVVPVRVQGDGAAGQVVHALEYLSREHNRLGIDAVIVTRGGGSPEDLAAFNEREVARAIVECRVPVVAAIGHETDTSLAELVADERCATPTQAAVRLTPDRVALGRQLDALAGRFRTDLARTLRFERQRLTSAARHPVLADPRGATRLAGQRLTALRAGLSVAVARGVQDADRRLEHAGLGIDRNRVRPLLAAARTATRSQELRLSRAVGSAVSVSMAMVAATEGRLKAVGPGAVLRRGFSCTTRPDGSIARRAADLKPGERLTTHLAEGSFTSDVIETLGTSLVDAAGPTSTTPSVPIKRKKPQKSDGQSDPSDEADQLDLFGGGG